MSIPFTVGSSSFLRSRAHVNGRLFYRRLRLFCLSLSRSPSLCLCRTVFAHSCVSGPWKKSWGARDTRVRLYGMGIYLSISVKITRGKTIYVHLSKFEIVGDKAGSVTSICVCVCGLFCAGVVCALIRFISIQCICFSFYI